MSSLFLDNRSATTHIKICGLTDGESVDVAVGSGAHAIGFVFVPSSPRFIEKHEADQLMLQLPEEVIGVAVLQDAPSLTPFEHWNGWLQLCGKENVSTVESAPCPVIKAIEWNEKLVRYWDGCKNLKAILVDGSTGGLGKTFDVTELAKIIPTLRTPIIIAGGLTPDNVQEVIQQAKPAAVDVSSGIESESGVKDPEKICAFIQAVVDIS
ncbi:MAG: phosphoribosylanthranilate isomerase [Phycisphaerae bacterium]|jgi:phosphoribosylanthranilate isomerase|nr:phosphoribosylanthranilate isomerase [Phycisphaerae bacterium]